MTATRLVHRACITGSCSACDRRERAEEAHERQLQDVYGALTTAIDNVRAAAQKAFETHGSLSALGIAVDNLNSEAEAFTTCIDWDPADALQLEEEE